MFIHVLNRQNVKFYIYSKYYLAKFKGFLCCSFLAVCRCIRGLLKNSIVVLVTHQVQFAVKSDKILVLNEVCINAMDLTVPIKQILMST